MICDDHALVLKCLGATTGRFTTIEIHPTIDEFVEVMAFRRPDLILAHARHDVRELLTCLSHAKLVDPSPSHILILRSDQLHTLPKAQRLGIDMVLHEGFTPADLQDSIEYLLNKQRSRPKPKSVFELDADLHGVRYRNGTPVILTDFEYAALKALLMSPGMRLETWQLMEIAERVGKQVEKPSIEVLISRLRNKLHNAGAPRNSILSVRQWGYRLVDLHPPHTPSN